VSQCLKNNAARDDMMKRKKILIISYYYLPDENPRVFRWSTIVSYWLSCGYDISLITASQGKSNSNRHNSLNIIRIPENWMGKIRCKASRVDGLHRDINDVGLSLFGNAEIISRLVKRLYSFVIKRLQWPDFAWTWVLNARKAILVHLENEPHMDVVISVSHPFSSHVACSVVKRRYPNIRWVVDVGDPFSFLIQSPPNNFFLYDRLNKFIEKKYFSQSDWISVTTSETRDEYLKLFPEIKKKIKVIPPVLNVEASNMFKMKTKRHQKHHKSLRFVYVGTLYSGIRNPAGVLNMLEVVRTRLNSDFELHFVGPVNDVDISEFENSYIYFHGSVSHNDALQFMLDADILINIGNSTNYQLPSKLIEYVCTANPVLNIITTNDDLSRAFLSKYQMSKTVHISGDITDDIVKEVADYIKLVSSHKSTFDNAWLSRHAVENISRQYELMFY